MKVSTMLWSRCSSLFVIMLYTVSIFTALAEETSTIQQENDPVVEQLLQACTEGSISALQDLLDTHSESLIHRRSTMGETCLHVAGIRGQAALTSYVLRHTTADPNVRSTFEHGLRMHPLSWNVYGGHVETVKALLSAGANVNLDVDDMSDPERKDTVLDIVDSILDGIRESNSKVQQAKARDDPNVKKYEEMRQLLLEYNAKSYKDL